MKIGGFTDNDTYTYDPNTGMATYKFTVGSTPKSMQGTLTWNVNGTLRELAITDQFNAGGAQTCNFGSSTTAGYDDLGRLVSANCGSLWSQSFSYDPFGNITKSGSLSWMPGYNQSTNRYTLAGTSYDANGNLLNDTFHSYVWDATGSPVVITAPNGITTCSAAGVTCLTYDALGRVVEKNFGGVFTEIQYSQLGKTSINSASSNTAYFPLPGGATEVSIGSTKNFLHKDWLGSARLATTPVGRVLTFDRAFAPFGEMYTNFGASDKLDFTGDTQDIVAGLFDTDNRELHPNQGRWISPDPAGMDATDPGNPQTWNLYAYVANNPLAFADPSGLLRSGIAGDPFDPGNDCGWDGFNDFGLNFCGFGDELLIQSTVGRLGCQDPGTPGCGYSWSPLDRQAILEGEKSIDWQVGPGGLAGLWQALGLPALPCQSQYGPWCDPSMLPNPWILDAEPDAANNVGMDIWHNSSQCPQCANLWKQADCTFNGTLKDEIGGVADTAATAAATGAITARSAGTQITKGVLKELGVAFTELAGILEYGKVMLKTGYNMVAGCQ